MSYSPEIKDRVRMILEQIRYNENPPPVTTMSGCMECGTVVRGGGLCSDCLRAMIRRIKDKADDERRAKRRTYNREYARKRRAKGKPWTDARKNAS